MKTMVTGASGLLGSNVVRELLNRGHQVRALVRKGSNTRTLDSLDVEIFTGDLLDDQNTLLDACRGYDYLIHAGGKVAGKQVKFKDFADINITGTQNIIRAAEKAGIMRMVHVSSCCVFSGGTMEAPGTELSEFNGFRFNSGYINSKYLAQQWILSEVEKKKLPIVVVNPTIMIGPYDKGPGSNEIVLHALKSHVQLCPVGGKNFTDVRDAAIATCNALIMGIPGECYLLASENLTFVEFFRKVNHLQGKEGLRIMIPGGLLNCAGLVGNVFRSFSHQDIGLNLVNTRQLATPSYFSAAKAVRVLGMPKRPVDEAIRAAISWFTENNYLRPLPLPAASVPAVA